MVKWGLIMKEVNKRIPVIDDSPMTKDRLALLRKKWLSENSDLSSNEGSSKLDELDYSASA